MNDCLFCNILKGDTPSNKVFENEDVFAFEDIFPMAKEHFLFIHKKHTKNVNDISKNDPSQLADIFKAINEFTESNELSKNGFRVVSNIGDDGGQTVYHTHFHVLGGEKLKGFGA
jgi:histidine triad (HIT) family protein